MIFDQIKTGVLRTLVPIIVALLIALGVKAGIHLDNVVVEQVVTDALSAILSAAYYVGVRALEHFKSSKWGWLLGSPNPPTYDKPAAK